MNRRIESRRFPYLPLTLELAGRTLFLDARIDTGFDGHVILPADLIPRNLPRDGELPWVLADGSAISAPFYYGSIILGALGAYPAVINVLGAEALLGSGIIGLLRVVFDHGERVLVEP